MMFVRPSADTTPGIHPAQDADDNNNIFAIVDPTITNISLLHSCLCQQETTDNQITLLVVEVWEAHITNCIKRFTREAKESITSAPASSSSQLQHLHHASRNSAVRRSKYNQNSSCNSSATASSPNRTAQQDHPQRASIPILRWQQGAGGNLSQVLKHNGPLPRFPTPADGQHNGWPHI